MLWMIVRITPVKVGEAGETGGLDSALHGEIAYLGEP
jgi:Amt family ammonium transporter